MWLWENCLNFQNLFFLCKTEKTMAPLSWAFRYSALLFVLSRCSQMTISYPLLCPSPSFSQPSLFSYRTLNSAYPQARAVNFVPPYQFFLRISWPQADSFPSDPLIFPLACPGCPPKILRISAFFFYPKTETLFMFDFQMLMNVWSQCSPYCSDPSPPSAIVRFSPLQ